MEREVLEAPSAMRPTICMPPIFSHSATRLLVIAFDTAHGLTQFWAQSRAAHGFTLTRFHFYLKFSSSIGTMVKYQGKMFTENLGKKMPPGSIILGPI